MAFAKGWTLHWDEDGQRWIHQDVTSWGVQWETKPSAINSSTCPEPHIMGENLPGLSADPRTHNWRPQPEAYWNVWCSSVSSADYEYSNIRCDTWIVQHKDLTFSFLLLLSTFGFIVQSFFSPVSYSHLCL